MSTVKMDQFDNPLARDTNVPMQPVGQQGYGYDAMNQQVMVQQTPATNHLYTEQFKWCDFVMSFITFILGGCCCVNPIVMVSSILGMVYSGNAFVQHGDGKYGSSRNSNSIAKVFWILSLVLVIISFVAIIVLVSVLVSALDTTVETINSMNQGN